MRFPPQGARPTCMETIPDELKREVASFLAEEGATWRLPPLAAASRAWLLAYVSNLPRCLCDVRRTALLHLLLGFAREQHWRGVLYAVPTDADSLPAFPPSPRLGLSAFGAHWTEHALDRLFHEAKHCRGIQLAALPELRTLPSMPGLEELHLSNCPSVELTPLLQCVRASAATLRVLTLRYLPAVAGASLHRHGPLPQLSALTHLRAVRCGAIGGALLCRSTSPAGVHASLQGEQVTLPSPASAPLHSLSLVCTGVGDRALEGAACSERSAGSLRHLSITRCAALVRPLLRCPNLLTAAFVRCDMLSDAAVATLRAECPRLRALTLRLCVNLMRPAIGGAALCSLEVSGCPNVTAAAMARAVVASPALESLEADDTELGANGTLEQCTAPRLAWLSARRSCVSRDALDRLAASGAFPRLAGAALSDGVWRPR